MRAFTTGCPRLQNDGTTKLWYGKMIIYGSETVPQWWSSQQIGGLGTFLVLKRSFRRLVIISFRDLGNSNFWFSNAATTITIIATIAMATRHIQQECTIQVQHISQRITHVIEKVYIVESCLLSKDEPLTPNIDGVMALWIFRRRAQNTQNRQKMDL